MSFLQTQPCCFQEEVSKYSEKLGPKRSSHPPENDALKGSILESRIPWELPIENHPTSGRGDIQLALKSAKQKQPLGHVPLQPGAVED